METQGPKQLQLTDREWSNKIKKALINSELNIVW